MMRRLLRTQLGQTGTEYMLVISVILVAVVGAAYVFVPSFQEGTRQLASDVSTILDSHQIGDLGVGATGDGQPVSGPSDSNAADSDGAVDGASPAAGENGDGRSRWENRRGNNGFFGGMFAAIFGDRQVASSGGTGGQSVEASAVTGGATIDNRAGISPESVGSYFEGEAQAAVSGTGFEGDPICGPAAIAAMLGKPLQDVMDSLKTNNRLDVVRTTGGVISQESTPGVMSADQVAAALKQDYGWDASTAALKGNPDPMAALRTLNDNNARVVILYDNNPDLAAVDGTQGHFATIKAITSTEVLIDHPGGREWMPIETFQKRFLASGGEVVTANPPSNPAGTFASK